MIEYQCEKNGITYLIRDDVFTIGDYARLGIVRDQIITHLGGDPSRSGKDVLNLTTQIAKVFIVVKSGLMPAGMPTSFSPEQAALSKPVINKLLSLDREVVAGIIKAYDSNSEVPLATSIADAKKK